MYWNIILIIRFIGLFKFFLFSDDIFEEHCSSICLLKIHLHIANISKNIVNVLHGVSDISLLTSNLKLNIMNKLKSNSQFEYVKIVFISNLIYLMFYYIINMYYSYRNLDEVVQQISNTVIKNLKSAIHIASNNSLCTKSVIDSYLMLAQYCLEELNHKGIWIIIIFICIIVYKL